MEPILSLRDIECRRSDNFTLALERLDFFPGRIYALTGPNGAGKSTLLRLLALLKAPDRGEILFAGETVRGSAARQRLRRQVTLVDQAPFLFATTVYQNLAFGLRLREIRGNLQQHRITRALKAMGLEGFEQRPARELSGGEAQRVALARAMVLHPRVLLLDEPTNSLDDASLPIFENWLSALSAEGITVVLATHDLRLPCRLGGQRLHLEGGRLAATRQEEVDLHAPHNNRGFHAAQLR